MKRMFFVILARPENPDNIGLIARAMKNTGFSDLRLTQVPGLDSLSYKTAVHAGDILDQARLYPTLAEAVADLELVFAATAKTRKNFSSLNLGDAVEKIFSFPASTKIGLLFGNERTGLTSEELRNSNFRFAIPQASRQPSYNLASAVLLTLFHIFAYPLPKKKKTFEKPLPRRGQETVIRLILKKLEAKRFVHRTNKAHVEDMVRDLFGRLTLTEKDQSLLLALFSKGVDIQAHEKERRT